MVKKLFLVLLVGMTGLSAAPPGEGGGDNTLQMITLRVDITASIAAPVMEAPMRPGGFFATSQGNDAAFTQDLDLMCLLHKKVITVLCSLYAQLTLISIYKSLYYNDLSNYFRIKSCYAKYPNLRSRAPWMAHGCRFILLYKSLRPPNHKFLFPQHRYRTILNSDCLWFYNGFG